MGNQIRAVRAGGTVVALMHCREGLGDYKLPRRVPPPALFRMLLSVLGSGVLARLSDCLNHGERQEDDFLVPLALDIAANHDVFVHAPAIGRDVSRRIPTVRFFPSLEAAVAAAYAKHGQAAQVGVFPWGGVTFPILPRRGSP